MSIGNEVDPHAEAIRQLFAIPGVARVGYGLKETAGAITETVCYRVYVAGKRPMAELPPEHRIPATVGGIPTDVIVGAVEATSSFGSTLHPGTEITRHRPGVNLAPGTLGLLLREGSDKFALTNQHVLNPNLGHNPHFTRVTLPSAGDRDVYSPTKKTCAGIDCNQPVAHLTERANSAHRANHAVGGRTFYVDAELLTLAADAEASNVADGIGAYDGGILETLTSDTAYPMGAVVTKRGATTGITQGRVTEVWHDDPPTAGGARIWKLGITPAAGLQVHDVDEHLELRGDQDAVAIASRISATPLLAAEGSNDGPVPRLHVHGSVNSLGGDSGATWVDSTTRMVVGLHFGVFGTEAYLSNGDRVVYGRAVACHISAVFDALGLTPSALMVPSAPSRAASALARPIPCPAAHGTADLERSLRQTAAGQRLLALAEEHGQQLMDLIHHRRRVTVVWHRSKGPAIAVAAIRALEAPSGSISPAVAGVDVIQSLERLRKVLLAEGDGELRAAVHQHGDWILELARRAVKGAALDEVLREDR